MSATPGPRTPADAAPSVSQETVNDTGVDTSVSGVAALGTLVAAEATVKEVRVNADNTSFDFNIEVDGSDIFSSEQSPGSTNEETFQPDQNTKVGGAGQVTVDIDISNTNAGSADVTVVLDVRPIA